MKKYNPGDIAPQSGKYCVCDKNGKIMDKVDVEKVKDAVPAETLSLDVRAEKALNMVKDSAVIK